MHIFLTGASGFIGSALIPELIAAGHTVCGLVRSDASASVVEGAGAQTWRGSLEDLQSLRDGADTADGVIHLAFNHDFSQFAQSAQTELRAIQTFGTVLSGTGKPLVLASGVFGQAQGRVLTEQEPLPSVVPLGTRAESALAALALARQGVRPAVVRLAPSVHDETKSGFLGALVEIARARGVSGYLGDGSQHWPAVHRLDAARLFRLAMESAPAGSVLHGVAEQGVPLRAIAELIGERLGIPVVAVPPEAAAEHFGWMAPFVGSDAQVSSTLTQDLLEWQPTYAGLLDDLGHGQYFNI